MFKREERENLNFKVTLLADPMFTAERVPGIDGPTPRGMLASCAVAIRTALRGMLVLLFEAHDKFLMLDTDIPRGVPPIVRAHSARMAERMKGLTLHLGYGGSFAKFRALEKV